MVSTMWISKWCSVENNELTISHCDTSSYYSFISLVRRYQLCGKICLTLREKIKSGYLVSLLMRQLHHGGTLIRISLLKNYIGRIDFRLSFIISNWIK